MLIIMMHTSVLHICDIFHLFQDLETLGLEPLMGRRIALLQNTWVKGHCLPLIASLFFLFLPCVPYNVFITYVHSNYMLYRCHVYYMGSRTSCGTTQATSFSICLSRTRYCVFKALLYIDAIGLARPRLRLTVHLKL